ncbi:MAG: hypothetical protein KBB88_01025 [Candidatus Pacebacteria bacterium]|nr:hypothetical protein [Candidatus Paceibacterota bacterium]
MKNNFEQYQPEELREFSNFNSKDFESEKDYNEMQSLALEVASKRLTKLHNFFEKKECPLNTDAFLELRKILKEYSTLVRAHAPEDLSITQHIQELVIILEKRNPVFEKQFSKLSSHEKESLVHESVDRTSVVAQYVLSELKKMNKDFFPLDAYYIIQDLIKNYRRFMIGVKLSDKKIRQKKQEFFNTLDKIEILMSNSNPLNKISDSDGNVLIHTTQFQNMNEMFDSQNKSAQVCATVGTLGEYNDIFRSKTRPAEMGFIYTTNEAKRIFYQDVGSHYRSGKRVYEERMKQYECQTLKEALDKGKKNVEVWVDIKQSQIRALLVLDPIKEEAVKKMDREMNIPVIYNSHLF